MPRLRPIVATTPEELADEMHIPVERVHALLKMARQPVSLQAPVGDDGDASVARSSKI